MDKICYVCKKNVVFFDLGGIVDCLYCGKYRITDEVITFKVLEKFAKDIYRLSAAIYKKTALGETIDLTTKSIPELIDSIIRKSPLETINDILENVSQKADSINDLIEFNEKDIPRFILKNAKELVEYIIQIEKLGYWEIEKFQPGKEPWSRQVKLTLDGWKRIDDIKKTKIVSTQAFVAMWFDDSMDLYYQKGIKPALQKTGFNPIINVKEIQHNEQITDLIFASIRRSGLLIADFTGNRPAVYYEAGFARGQNIQVIYLCKESDRDELSFDTRQYNHIFWKDATDLKEQLINRIEATIPGHLAK